MRPRPEATTATNVARRSAHALGRRDNALHRSAPDTRDSGPRDAGECNRCRPSSSGSWRGQSLRGTPSRLGPRTDRTRVNWSVRAGAPHSGFPEAQPHWLSLPARASESVRDATNPGESGAALRDPERHGP